MKSKQTVFEYSKDNILVIPQSLIAMKDVSVLLRNEQAMILYKCLSEDLTDIEFYTNMPCVVYVENGQEVITTSDNQTHKLVANMGVWLPQGLNLHSDYVRTTESLRAYLLFFDNAVINRYLSSHKKFTQTESNYTGIFKIEGNKAFQSYFSSIQAIYRQGIQSSELLKIKLIEFLHLIALTQQNFDLPTLLLSNDTVHPKRNIVRLLEKEETFQLTVKDLAHLSGRSLSTFTRDFKATYKKPPGRWLQERRLAHAHKLLIEDDLSVTDVAILVGYENISHFIKAFKAKYGVTPKKLK